MPPYTIMSLYDRDYMRPSRSSWSLRGRSIDAFQWVFWLNIAVFVIQYVLGYGMVNTAYGPMPLGGVSLELLSEGRVWTIFTYMFVHGSLGHVLVNMIFLWFVGRQVQQLFGGAHFLRLYILSGLLGAALEIAVRAWFSDAPVYVVGASASVLGLFIALAVTMPEEVITALIYFVIPVRVRLGKLAIFVVALNVVLGLGSLFWSSGGVGGATAYFAHLGGALTGWYYIRMLGFGGNPLTYRRIWQPEDRQAQPPKSDRDLIPARKRRLALDLELDHEAARKRNPTGDPKVNLIQDEVDPILDKISDYGFQSLTEEELRTLERASRIVANPPPKPKGKN